jgi:hypothetical protein
MIGGGSDDEDGNGYRRQHEEEKVVALGKGVRAGAHLKVGLTRGVEKRSAWWRSSVRRLVRWLLTSGATPAARRKGRG